MAGLSQMNVTATIEIQQTLVLILSTINISIVYFKECFSDSDM